jgi:hypothetical protein
MLRPGQHQQVRRIVVQAVVVNVVDDLVAA